MNLSLSAQEYGKGLIFSEVYLDDKHPEKSWVEVYNPTDETLRLGGFRLSNIRAISIIPRCNMPEEEIVLVPGECVILCASKEKFHMKWGKRNNVVEVPLLSTFEQGGFMALRTAGLKVEGNDGFRYGDPTKSDQTKALRDSQVLTFSKNGKSYCRDEIKSANGRTVSTFYPAEPTPGQKNKNKESK